MPAQPVKLLLGDRIKLRALEPQDVDLLYRWENDPEVWKVSNTITPFSRFVLEQYIATAHLDLFSNKQLRLMITTKDARDIGCIDLFDYDPHHQRAGVGILIAEHADRRQGFASEAMTLLIDYCFRTLYLHQLYCNITVDNQESVLLFQRHKFTITGIKKDWIRSGEKFTDELLLQLVRGNGG